MKARFRRLTRAQKVVLVVTVLLALAFSAIYAVGFSQKGIWLEGGFLVYAQPEVVTYVDEGVTRTTTDVAATYTGKVEGARLTVAVMVDKTIYTQWGDVTHGPYTVREDPTALPQAAWDGMTGVEVREGDALLFWGGWLSAGGTEAAMTQDGQLRISSPVTYDQPPLRELTFHHVLRLWSGPELVRRASALWYLTGLFVAVLGVLSLLFAEKLFRWNLSWMVQDPDSPEPSGWEIGKRTLCAAIFALLALACWILGLRNR